VTVFAFLIIVLRGIGNYIGSFVSSLIFGVIFLLSQVSIFMQKLLFREFYVLRVLFTPTGLLGELKVGKQ
jgi:branched-subunit amino acid ABC-type transport system permease component